MSTVKQARMEGLVKIAQVGAMLGRIASLWVDLDQQMRTLEAPNVSVSSAVLEQK
jgi:hypothetical protein